ncbi:MAG: hypothetical protein ACOCP8_00990 [archaeon]
MIPTHTLEELRKETEIYRITYKKGMRFIALDDLWEWIDKNKELSKEKMISKLVQELEI